jgi:C-terminus of histone H2A
MKSESNKLSPVLLVLKDPQRLNKLLGDVVISQGGVVPHINPEVCFRVYAQLGVINLWSFSSFQAKPRRARRRVRKYRYSILNFCPLLYVLYYLVVITLFFWIPVGALVLRCLTIMIDKMIFTSG